MQVMEAHGELTDQGVPRALPSRRPWVWHCRRPRGVPAAMSVDNCAKLAQNQSSAHEIQFVLRDTKTPHRLMLVLSLASFVYAEASLKLMWIAQFQQETNPWFRGN